MPRPSRITLTSLATYLVIAGLFLAEKAGQVTTDTKAGLVTDPGGLLRSTFSLWNPQESLGDLQNQAYGYLFPMGSFFAGLHALDIPLWIVERLWSLALVVVAWEGAKLLCRELGLAGWPSWFAGTAYALSPRMLSELGVRSAELDPTAVLPWILLPVVLVLRGRISERTGALLAAAATLFEGVVNGTATLAPLPLVLVFIVWGCRRGLARWRLLGWFGFFGVLVSIWWASALLLLQSYSPPFFDYVEDAAATTRTSGFDSSLRGLSYWVGYLTTGPRPTWPAAWSLTYQPVLVVLTGVVAVVGLVGLVRLRSGWRTPLLVAAVIGLACMTIGHTSEAWAQSPLGPTVRALLDHPFALLRNITKIDPVLRLPLAIGFAGALEELARHGLRRPRLATLTTVGIVAALLVTLQPLFALNLRTPGWTKVPAYWTQTADYLAARPGANTAWIVPGSSFAIQPWGATFDEPMSMVARSPWVSRSQVPLVPAPTIRMLDSLESLIDTGSGSPQLGAMLARIGIGYVVVRHDLSAGLAEQPTTSLVGVALARSGGLRRVKTFGSADFGPAIEVYKVTTSQPADEYRITADNQVATVASGPADVIASVGLGVIDGLRAAVVEGQPGWDHPAQVVGDGYQLRVRNFGLAHGAEGPVLAPGEPRHATRKVQNYPGSPGAKPVVAAYDGITYADASTSQAFAGVLGPVRPEEAPFSAVDGDPRTAWTTASFTKPLGQYLEVHFPQRRSFGDLRIESPAGGAVSAWSVSAGGHSVRASVDPRTGGATADLGDVRGRTLRLTVAAVRGANVDEPVAINEIEMAGLPARRTLVVPKVATAAKVDFIFQAEAETRPCVPTLLGPDCRASRYRPSSEGLGIDRTFTVDHAGSWQLSGNVIARTSFRADQLLGPGKGVVMHGSSTYFGDPQVSARMAYDGSATTSWIAAPTDRTPILEVTFPKTRTVNRISVARPAAPAVAPTQAVITAGSQRRVVHLDQWGTFKPLRAKHLRITFSNPVAGLAPLGVAELGLGPGKVAQAFDGATATGASCGFGPNVYVDGKRRLTAVRGLMGDVASGGSLALSLCGKPLHLKAGTHRIRIVSTTQFQPTAVVLRADALLPAATAHRTVRVVSDRATNRRIEVGPGAASVLEMTGNVNKGWRAELDGHTLVPIVVDGWAQGWRLPAGAGGTVRITFTPQAAYLRWLIGGLVIAGLVLLAAIVAGIGAWRRRGTVTDAVEVRPAGPSSPRRHAVLAAVGLAGAWLVFGLPGVLGVLLGLLLGRMPTVRIAAGAVVMLAGSVVTAIHLHEQPYDATVDVANFLAGVGALVLLTAGARGARPE